MTAEKKYLYNELPEKIKDQIYIEAGLLTAVEGDDLVEAQNKALDWIKKHDYPKTIFDWTTYAQ